VAANELKCGVWPYRPEEFGSKKFLLKSIAYNATARSDMFTLPCSNKVCCSDNSVQFLCQNASAPFCSDFPCDLLQVDLHM